MVTFSAEVNVLSAEEVTKLGSFRFAAVPNAGDALCIGEVPADVWLRVASVIHFPAAAGDSQSDPVIVLNCEIDT
ncbi:MAG: hypothetical protein ACOY45_02260 [Pseudomonadota bacterium]